MERVKVFYAVDNSVGLEKQINDWLELAGATVEITRVLQNASGRLSHHVTITIFYKSK